MKVEPQAGAAPEPGPWRVYRGSVAKGRNEVEDGKAVAGSVGSARTFLGADRELATAQR